MKVLPNFQGFNLRHRMIIWSRKRKENGPGDPSLKRPLVETVSWP